MHCNVSAQPRPCTAAMTGSRCQTHCLYCSSSSSSSSSSSATAMPSSTVIDNTWTVTVAMKTIKQYCRPGHVLNHTIMTADQSVTWSPVCLWFSDDPVKLWSHWQWVNVDGQWYCVTATFQHVHHVNTVTAHTVNIQHYTHVMTPCVTATFQHVHHINTLTAHTVNIQHYQQMPTTTVDKTECHRCSETKATTTNSSRATRSRLYITIHSKTKLPQSKFISNFYNTINAISYRDGWDGYWFSAR